MPFAYPEDEVFFHALLCDEGESLSQYMHLFDFRLPDLKRAEFNAARAKILVHLIERSGAICQLKLLDNCDITSGIVVDHVVPLSSNQLNKTLRNMEAPKGKKVPTQSFGSNHHDNLIIACNICNNHKKHRILQRADMKRLLRHVQPQTAL